MTDGEIAELFIRAAETERKMPRTGTKPKGFSGCVISYIHTSADIQGWGKQHGDHLEPGDDPLHKEWRWGWFDKLSELPTRADVDNWEKCIRWTMDLLDNEGQRRALWNWAHAKAGGRPFKKWCFKVERIHPETGSRRKNRALAAISDRLARDGAAHNGTGGFGVLPETPDFGHVSSTLDSEAGERKDPNFWAPDAAFKSFISVYDQKADGRIKADPTGATAAELRNYMRRKREAMKRKQEAA